jgi:hypothetical protein
MTALVQRLAGVPDGLNPMVVKELRQGVKSRGFLLAFGVIQVLFLLGTLAGAAGSDDAMQGFMWPALGIIFLLIQPIRGLVQLRGEWKRGALELVQVSHLTPWQIVAGKWMALAAEAGLLVVSILPYFLVRYYLGGREILVDTAILASLAAAGSVCTAAALALAALRLGHFVATIAAILLVSPMALPLLVGLLMLVASAMDHPAKVVLFVFVLTAAAAGFFLGLAAIRVAPPRYQDDLLGVAMAFLGLGFYFSLAIAMAMQPVLGAFVLPFVPPVLGLLRRGTAARPGGRVPLAIGMTILAVVLLMLLDGLDPVSQGALLISLPGLAGVMYALVKRLRPRFGSETHVFCALIHMLVLLVFGALGLAIEPTLSGAWSPAMIAPQAAFFLAASNKAAPGGLPYALVGSLLAAAWAWQSRSAGKETPPPIPEAVA